MAPYVLFADSSCDLPQKTLEQWGIRYGSLYFRFDDSEKEYHNYDMSAKEFYAKMRAGHSCKTAAVNASDFAEAFQKTDCSAALAASLFHFRELTVQQVKDDCRAKGIIVR